jgi:LEA14-like dessication related protein
MRPLPRFLIVLSLLAVLLAGCLGSVRLRGIAVEIQDLQAVATADGGAEVTLGIHYRNENNIAIAISSARHRVTIGNINLGRVDAPRPIGLPRLSSEVQPATVRVDAATAQRLRDLQAAGSTTYQIQTTIIVEAAADKLESRTANTGTIDVRQIGL